MQSNRTALYRLFDQGGVLLYVGVTGNPTARFSNHASTKSWWTDVASHTIKWHTSRVGAEVAERAAIQAELPRWNRQHARTPLPPELAALFAAYKKALLARRKMEVEISERAVKCLREGVSTTRLARMTGKTDETFRTLARKHGIEPAPEHRGRSEKAKRQAQ